MHNIATVRAASTAFDTIDTTVPGLDGSYSFDNPVLTVANPTAWADKVREVSFLLKADGIVVNPWTEHRVEVLREDLFALRELLAEMPEEAFVRPADPVEKAPRWTDGDVVRNSRTGYLYERRDGEWFNISRHGSDVGFPDGAMSVAVDDFPDINIVLFKADA